MWTRNASIGALTVLTALGLHTTPVMAEPQAGSDVSKTNTNDFKANKNKNDSGYHVDGYSGYHVNRYDVHVSYTPQGTKLTGDTTIELTARADLRELSFTLVLPAQSVEIDGTPAKSFTSSDQALTVVPAKSIGSGETARIRIRYAGDPGKESPAWVPTEDGGAVAVTGASAGTWFPTNTDVSDSANLRVSASVPPGWVAVSNGLEQPPRQGNDSTTFRWQTTEPLRSNAAVLGVGKWDVERSRLDDGTQVVNVFGAGLKEKAEPMTERLPEVMAYEREKFGAYPYASVGAVVVEAAGEDVPNYAGQGRVVLMAGNGGLRTDVLVHELAHQWYGNSVGAADMCADECVPSYTQWLWLEHAQGQDTDAKYRDRIEKTEEDEDWWKKHETSAMGAYDRGPLALHALRRTIGDTAFSQVIRQWPQRYAGTSRSWDDFEKLTEEISGQDLGGFFQAWFRGDTVPEDAYLWPGDLRP